MKKLALLSLSAIVLFSCDNGSHSKDSQTPSQNGKDQEVKNGSNGAAKTNGTNGATGVNGVKGVNSLNGTK